MVSFQGHKMIYPTTLSIVQSGGSWLGYGHGKWTLAKKYDVMEQKYILLAWHNYDALHLHLQIWQNCQ